MSMYKSVLRHYVGLKRANELLSRAKPTTSKNQSMPRKQAQKSTATTYHVIPTKKEMIAAVVQGEPQNENTQLARLY